MRRAASRPDRGLRGGGWSSHPWGTQVVIHGNVTPDVVNRSLSLRLVRRVS